MTRLRRPRPFVCAFGVLLALPAAAGAQLEIRGRAEPLPDSIVAVDLEGVTIVPATREAPGQARLVSWDMVRSVGPSRHPGAAPDDASRALSVQAATFARSADQLFRARVRLERGDWPSAEPLFEQLFRQYRGRLGPSAALTADGLLRCRLARGARASAVIPWLELLRIEAAGRSGSKGAGPGEPGAVPPADRWIGGRLNPLDPGLVPQAVDPVTGLVPDLPPMMPGVPATSVQQSSDAPGPGTGGFVADLAALYAHASAFESTYDPASPPSADAPVPSLPVLAEPDHPGVRLVSEVVAARTGDASARARARDRLAFRLLDARTPAWADPWIHLAIARSLAREPDPALRRQSVLRYLRVPASYAVERPELAAQALAECAQLLRILGDSEAADALDRDARARFASRGPGSAAPPGDAGSR